jgi:N-acyl homoserine lactone hydrolase
MVRFAVIHIGTLSRNKFWGENERRRQGTATCTLLEADGQRLLVDPSPEAALLESLLYAHSGLQMANIDRVFVTHFHADHRVALEAFPGVPWLMARAGLEEWREGSPQEAGLIDRFQQAEGRLPAGIELLATPGHTRGHHALQAATPRGRLVVAGDAVMTEEFLAAEEGYHNSVDFDQARRTIRELKQSALLLIPGHGNLVVTREF